MEPQIAPTPHPTQPTQNQKPGNKCVSKNRTACPKPTSKSLDSCYDLHCSGFLEKDNPASARASYLANKNGNLLIFQTFFAHAGSKYAISLALTPFKSLQPSMPLTPTGNQKPNKINFVRKEEHVQISEQLYLTQSFLFATQSIG